MGKIDLDLLTARIMAGDKSALQDLGLTPDVQQEIIAYADRQRKYVRKAARELGRAVASSQEKVLLEALQGVELPPQFEEK